MKAILISIVALLLAGPVWAGDGMDLAIPEQERRFQPEAMYPPPPSGKSRWACCFHPDADLDYIVVLAEFAEEWALDHPEWELVGVWEWEEGLIEVRGYWVRAMVPAAYWYHRRGTD